MEKLEDQSMLVKIYLKTN